jgi:peroxiredoxin
MRALVVVLLFFSLSFTLVKGQSEPFEIKKGEIALDFEAKDQFGNTFKLYEAIEKGPVVLMFYRGYWCPYCNEQLSELQDSLSFITEKGGVVVAVTPEKPANVNKTIKKTDASFKIIHDRDLKIMNAYHVAFELEEGLIKKYKRWGIDLDKNNGDNGPNLPVPATYIIGQDKKIIFSFFDPDHKKRATVGKILQNL